MASWKKCKRAGKPRPSSSDGFHTSNRRPLPPRGLPTSGPWRMTPEQVMPFLRAKVGLLTEFSDYQLRQLVDGSRVESFETNEAIVHHGAPATHFRVILSGAVNFSVSGDGG